MKDAIGSDLMRTKEEERGPGAEQNVPVSGETEQHVTSELLQARIAEIWKSILGTDSIGYDDDFLDSGGESLTAALIAAKIRLHFQVEIPLPAFFEWMTISEMASIVYKARCESATRPVN